MKNAVDNKKYSAVTAYLSSSESLIGEYRIIGNEVRKCVARDISHALKGNSKMSQGDIARLMGVSRQRINQILIGKIQFTLSTLAKYAVALDRQLVVRLIRHDEAMPIVPVSLMPQIQKIIQGKLKEDGSGAVELSNPIAASATQKGEANEKKDR